MALQLDGRTCIDINECTDNPRICGGGKCINTKGSHKCQCGDGLLPNSEFTSCIGNHQSQKLNILFLLDLD